MFFTAVLATGIFCRPTCTARKPLPVNVAFYATAADAAAAGFRACLRCHPLEYGSGVPAWLQPLFDAVNAAPDHRWSQADIARHGVAPARARVWFKQHYDITFSEYVRTRRLGRALAGLQSGDNIDGVASDCGYDSVSGFRDAFQKAFGVAPGQAAGRRALQHQRIATPLGPMLAMAEPAGLSGTGLPLNLMAVSGLPPMQRLDALGVRRLSAGPALAIVTYAQCETAARAFLAGTADALHAPTLGFADMDADVGPEMTRLR